MLLPVAYTEWLNAFACPVFRVRYESAELAKIAVNMFLTSSVCTANTLAELCEVLGANWTEIVPTLQADCRIGPQAYLQPGLGVGGGNLERDLVTVRELASQHGTEAGVVEAWFVNSVHRRHWVLRALHHDVLSARPDPIIAVWGLAYKPHTRSTKNAPSLQLLEALRGVAMHAYDPQVQLPAVEWPHVTHAPSALEACRDADALAILTAWPEFASIDPEAIRKLMRGRLVLDPFGVLDDHRCAEAGLVHRRLGVPVDCPELVPC
jgi:UDPglucose 6-dehydrogenase